MSDKYTRDNISLYYKDVEMPGGYAFNHVHNLKRIDMYYNSQFESGQYDSRGYRKFFYNISKPACDIATKFVDLDTKDILLTSERPDDELKVWMMQKDLRQWLKENKFGELLNKIGFDYPKYGHIFLKKDKDGSWKKVNIHNLRFDPSSSSFETDSFFYELHLMTKKDIDSMAGWDSKAKQELFNRGGQGIYNVYSCYDYNSDRKKKWRFTVKADIWSYRDKESGAILRGTESAINDEQREYIPALVLFGGEVDELPYRELKWEEVVGRRMGLGFMEYLFENQIRMNEIVNIKGKGLYFTALKLYQTRDETVGKNVFTDVENGDIIKTNAEINPVINEERNLAVFNQEEQRWDLNTERKTFSFDISRGENLPSRTPLGVANLSAGMVASYFELKRENFGLFIKDLLLNDIIPSFQNKSVREHILTFLGSDTEIEKLNKAVSEILVNNDAFDYAMKTGFFPDKTVMEDEKLRVRNELKKKKNLYLKIPDGFYRDAKYLVDVVITGEQMDTGVKMQTLQMVLQLLNTNPMILKDRGIRTVFSKLLELGGISPIELNLLETDEDEMAMNMMLPQGGSIAAPQQPVQGQMPTMKAL